MLPFFFLNVIVSLTEIENQVFVVCLFFLLIFFSTLTFPFFLLKHLVHFYLFTHFTLSILSAEVTPYLFILLAHFFYWIKTQATILSVMSSAKDQRLFVWSEPYELKCYFIVYVLFWLTSGFLCWWNCRSSWQVHETINLYSTLPLMENEKWKIKNMEACNGQILTQVNLTYCEQVLICKGMHLFTNNHVNVGKSI